jgi:hypothetical protein
VVVGGALVIPVGLLQRLQGKREPKASMFARETKRVEMLAMNAVMAAEKKLGHEAKDVSSLKCGYDIESRILETGTLRFIEVKGRIKGAETVTVTKNEIITALNKPEHYILAIVEVAPSEEFNAGDAWKVKEPSPESHSGACALRKERSSSYKVGEDSCIVRYVRQPFQKEPDFGVTSVNYDLKELKQRSQKPC